MRRQLYTPILLGLTLIVLTSCAEQKTVTLVPTSTEKSAEDAAPTETPYSEEVALVEGEEP